MKKIKNGLGKSVGCCLLHSVLGDTLQLDHVVPKSAREIGANIGRSAF